MTDVDARPSTRLHLVGAWLGIAFAAGIGAVRFFGEESPVRAAEWWVADIALAAVIAFPACLAFMGGRRPALLLAAGIVSFPLIVISFVAVPLLVPAVLYLVAYRRRGAPGGSAAILIALCAGLAPLGLIIFVPGQIVCWTKTVYEDGRTVSSRDRISEEASSPGHFSSWGGPPRDDVSSEQSGCTDGAIRPGVSLAAVGIVTLGVLSARRFTTP